MLHYYCGFTKLANPEIQVFISFFQTGKTSIKELLPLLHCFFEAQQPSLCQLVDSRFIPNEHQTLNSRDLTPVDFLVVGYFITSLLSTSTANTPTIHLVVDSIDNHCLKMLLNELSKYPVGGIPTSAGALSLELHSPLLTKQGVSHIASHLCRKYSFIIELQISNGTFHAQDVLLPIAEAMQTNRFLTNLSLPNMSLHYTEQNGSALMNVLQINNSLTHLDLSNNSAISDSGARCIFEGFQYNTTVVNLNLSDTGITATDRDTTKAFTEMLQANKSLTHLDLSNNSAISDSGTHCIFNGLQYNTTIVNLNLSNTGITATDRDTTKAFTEMLKANKSLTHLDLSRNVLISDSGARCILKGLQHNTVLINLNLSNTGITATDRDTAKAFSEMLQVNKSL